MDEAEPFTYDGGRVDPGETRNVRYTASETYLGDPVRMPVTIINGERPEPRGPCQRRPTATNSTVWKWSARSPTSGS